MDHIEEFVDERQKIWCVHCGGLSGAVETNRDHVPSKSLLIKPLPENLPVIQVCKSCNESFSLDEEYLVCFLSCLISGTTNPKNQLIPQAKKILEHAEGLRKRIKKGKVEQGHLFEESQIVWHAEIERINRVVLKNARGHAFYEYGEPMLENPTLVSTIYLAHLSDEKRNNYETLPSNNVFPEIGSRMMTRVLTGQDMINGWVVVQEGVYRYAVVQEGKMLVRSVLFETLATEVFWEN